MISAANNAILVPNDDHIMGPNSFTNTVTANNTYAAEQQAEGPTMHHQNEYHDPSRRKYTIEYTLKDEESDNVTQYELEECLSPSFDFTSASPTTPSLDCQGVSNETTSTEDIDGPPSEQSEQVQGNVEQQRPSPHEIGAYVWQQFISFRDCIWLQAQQRTFQGIAIDPNYIFYIFMLIFLEFIHFKFRLAFEHSTGV
ncbi:hypothetical protein M422DRAFT_254363 [Sphaerobolus stellatus SS14]|uniref:Uncharacterized protein n=1 Tax=Sphaerobolus stellatus (strain SS14) TaxID=990650 RepID=A0A0C9VLG6_SPHS4|nr:hypothetical protein M422DRAFT_254363 [Sphaerobolus stellatus SS14]